MKKYLIFDLDGTLIQSQKKLVKIVINYFEKNFGENKEKILNLLSTTRGMSIREITKKLLNISDEKAKKIADNIYKEINKYGDYNFFPGVIEKIEELSKQYKIFLSTGNSTIFAENNLKKGNIYNCFEYILGSEKILKSDEHIKFFKEISLDENFEKHSIFIGDGEKDREIAKFCGIDFIHIDENLENKFNDKFEIKSVTEIDKILNKLK